MAENNSSVFATLHRELAKKVTVSGKKTDTSAQHK
jgi:hypothetical protein